MIIICYRPGQLGNSLFLFSHFMAYALETKTKLMNVSFYESADYFTSTHNSTFLRFPPKKIFFKTRWLRRPVYRFFFQIGRAVHRLGLNNSFVNCVYLDWDKHFFLDEAKNRKELQAAIVFVQGWNFRCTPYVKKHQGMIRNFFQPLEKYRVNVERIIADAKKGCDLLVGVHIRHGDYAHFEGGKYFYSLEQYYAEMLKVAGLYTGSRIRFLICSNATPDLSAFKNLDCCFSSGHELEDMYALAGCDMLMGPPSTYSIWASFYGNVPLYMINDLHRDVEKKDFQLPEEWMK
jgi:hypothetical protein